MSLSREDLLGPDPHPLRLLALEAMAAGDRALRVERLRREAKGREAAFFAFGQRNRIGPIVAHALLEAFPDAPARDEWRALHDASLHRMQVLLAELDAVAARLAREDIRLVALKNAGIARGIFPCAGCCPMGDLDVLIDRARFREAHRLVEECGFRLASRSVVEPADLELGLESGGTEYVKESSGEEVWFELQWRPIAGRWIRADQEPAGTELLARSVPIPGTEIRLLEPTDNMLQVALHTAKHSYVRAPGLRLHTDVDRLAYHAPPDWDAVVRRARALSVTTATYLSLAMAAALLDARVPRSALDALEPPAWKRRVLAGWIRRADVFEPDAPKFRRPEMMVFHALLYDDARGLASSALATPPGELRLSNLPAIAGRGARRIADLARRYQR